MWRLPLIALLVLIAGCSSVKDLSGEDIYARCAGAIVEVAVQDDNGRIRSTGSGIILKDSAWLVTNYHIFKRGGYIMAAKDGIPLDLTPGIVRADHERDVLIIKIGPGSFPELWERIPRLDLVRYDQLKRGQKVYAIGNPRQLETTITDGLVSGLRTAMDTSHKLVQISAAISPGSSGGGVFDAQGRLIGMSTFMMDPEQSFNLNFALPVDEIVDWDREATRKDINERVQHPEFVKGLNAWNDGDCEEAIAHFRKVPEDAPMKGRALYFTARCFHAANQLELAKEGYYRALKADRKIARAHAYLAMVLQAQGDHVTAMLHQRLAYDIDPTLRGTKVGVNDPY
jgi:hypothetical protein